MKPRVKAVRAINVNNSDNSFFFIVPSENYNKYTFPFTGRTTWTEDVPMMPGSLLRQYSPCVFILKEIIEN